MAETKYLGRTGAKAILKAAKQWDAQVLSDAKDYADGKIADIPGYELPKASATVLGGIKLGQGLQADSDGKVKVVLEGIEVNPANIAKASATGFGVVKVGSGINVAEGVISVDFSDYSTTTEVNTIAENKAKAAVAEVVNGAPESLDTLKEIADTLNKDTEGGVVKGILDTIASNKTDLQGKIDLCMKTADLVEFTDAEIAAIATEVLNETV